MNAVVDPDEAVRRLPDGVQPHVTAEGTVVGCCLLELADVRPARLPAATGISVRAAAHRISIEWRDHQGERVVGVYVPSRLTDSPAVAVLGGRWFPGVHRRARIDVHEGAAGFSWRITDGDRLDVAVAVSLPPERREATSCDRIAGVCLGATIGLSPDQSGALDAVRMEPAHRNACKVAVDDLTCGFISGFSTAALMPAYLMEDVTVTWTPTPAPALTSVAPR